MGKALQTHFARFGSSGSLVAGGVLAILLWAGSMRGDGADPGARWLTLYGWIQTAERLAEGGQWALATGSYVEARRLIEGLAADHPDFEPEMVAYRSAKLDEAIVASESRLADDEHATMMKYLDFIESFELGQAQRYANEFEAAYGTLNMARAVLDEIVAEKPDSFRAAIASQYDRLVDGINWIDSQINFKEASRPATFHGDGVDWGTTQYVRHSDLPKRDEGTLPMGILFPGALSTGDAGRSEAGAGAVEEPGPERDREPALAPVRFRMSSQKKPRKEGDAP